jgi:transposase
VSKERRRFTREFKLAALARFEEAGDVRELAQELGIRRELLYKWRSKYEAGGSSALTTTGRPRAFPMPSAEAVAGLDDADRARRRIAELERKVGQQQVELDFFREALRQVKDLSQANGGLGGRASTRRSK